MTQQIQVARLVAPLIADATDFAKGLTGATSDAKEWGADIGKTIGKAGLAVVASGAALAAGAVLGLGVAIGKMTLDAAAVEGTVNTFNALVLSVGGDAVQAMEMLRASTRGMVADSDLMAASNKFLAMGIVDTTEEAAKLAEVSTQLGMAMGEDATASMENFALMMANQSIPRLDSFGISSGAVRTRIIELMEATQDMTREEAFKIAVMEQSAITMAKVGEQSDTVAGSMGRIKTTIANVSLGIGQAFLPALQSILTPIADIAQDVGPQLIEWAQMAGQWLGDKIPVAIDKIIPPIQKFIDGIMSLVNYFMVVIEEGDTLNDFLSHLPEPIQPIVQWLGEFIGILQEAIGVLQSGQGPFAAIMEMLDNFLPEGTIDMLWGFYDTASEIVSKVTAWVTEFVSWKDVLIALGLAIASVVVPAIISIVTTMLPIIALVAAVILAIAFLRNVFENDLGGIRTFLEGVVAKMVEAWNTIVKVFEEAGIRDALAEVGAAFGEVWVALEELWAVVLPILDEIFGAIREAFGSDDPVTFADVVKGVAGVVMGALKGIVGYLKLAAKVWSGFAVLLSEAWNKHGAKIIEGISKFVKDIVKFFERLRDALVGGSIIPDMMNAILSVITKVLEAVEKVFNTIWNAIKIIVVSISSSIRATIDIWLSAIQTVMTTVWNAISALISAVWGAIQTAINTISAAIKTTIDTWLGAIQTAMTTIWNAVSTLISTVWGAIQTTINTISGAIQTTINTWLGAIQTAWNTMWNAVSTLINTVWGAIQTTITTITGAVQGIINTWLAAIQTAIETVMGTETTGIRGIINTVWNAIKTIFETIIGTGSGEGIWGTVVSAFNAILDIIKDSIGWSAVTGAWGIISSAWSAIEDIFEDIIGTSETGIWGTVVTGFDAIETAIDTVMTGIDTIISGAWAAIKGYFIGGLNGIIAGVNDFISVLNDIISAINDLFGLDIDDLPFIPPLGGDEGVSSRTARVPGMGTLATATAVGGIGGRRGASMREPAGVAFHTTVNTPIEWNEFVFMVQEALREI